MSNLFTKRHLSLPDIRGGGTWGFRETVEDLTSPVPSTLVVSESDKRHCRHFSRRDVRGALRHRSPDASPKVYTWNSSMQVSHEGIVTGHEFQNSWPVDLVTDKPSLQVNVHSERRVPDKRAVPRWGPANNYDNMAYLSRDRDDCKRSVYSWSKSLEMVHKCKKSGYKFLQNRDWKSTTKTVGFILRGDPGGPDRNRVCQGDRRPLISLLWV